jgi:hypothetical protein
MQNKLRGNRQNELVTSKENLNVIGPYGIGNPFITPKGNVVSDKDSRRDISRSPLLVKSGVMTEKQLIIHAKRHSELQKDRVLTDIGSNMFNSAIFPTMKSVQ